MMHSQEDVNCITYRNMLYDYVSDNLSEQDRADFLMHINNCPDCKRELNELEAILGAASEIEEIEVPDSVKTAVSSALANESVKIRKRRSIYKFAVSTALPIAACAALAIGIYSGGIYDNLNNADNMITDAPITSVQPDSSISEDKSTQGAQDIPDVQPDKEIATSEDSYKEVPQHSAKPSGSPSKRTKADTPASSGNSNKASNNTSSAQSESVSSDSSTAEPQTQDSNSPSGTAPRENTSSAAITEESIASPTPEAPAASSARASGRNTSSSNSGGGSSSAPMLKSVKPPESNPEPAMEEHLPDAASAISTEEDAVFEAPECAEPCDDSDTDKKPVKNGHCTVTVSDPSAFAKGFGISGSGSSITFTISADRWREFVNYCRSNGASASANFPADQYNSVTITITKGS